MSGVSILVTTVDGAEKARELARAALSARLAACVQISQVESHYVWQGAVCEAQEYLLQLKCRAEDYAALAALLRSLHPYETPEIMRLNAVEADLDYEAWLRDSTRRG